MIDPNDALAILIRLQDALQEFMDIWGSQDAHSNSKRAQARRAAMWERAEYAMYWAKRLRKYAGTGPHDKGTEAR